MHLGCRKSCKPPGRIQVHNPGGVICQNFTNHKSLGILKALKSGYFWTVELFIFSDTDLYKPLIYVSLITRVQNQ